jgi:predicted Na+-dependent transporter
MTKHPFHPYIFSRYCAQFVTLGLPFLSLILFLIIDEKKKNILSKKINLILTIILTVSVLNFLTFTHKFSKYSNDFTIIPNSEITEKLDLHNSILVADKPDHRILSLALYGPIYNLTSDWAVPYFRSSPLIGRRLKVYKVEILNNNATFNLIGHLNINKDLTGPINANEILKNPNFEKIN